MSKENTRIFECFRTGVHVTMSGRETLWTSEDLEQICSNYRRRPNRAPLVLGHPADNLPAFGEVGELFHRNGRLYAVAQVGAGLLEAVKQGYYRHVSAAFEAAASVGGRGWNLRHIGFLGAIPPAVKGLAALNFGEMVEPPGAVCFAASGGHLPPARKIVVPAGWHVTPEGWACYERAQEVWAGCPHLSFAECASLADQFLL